ncbi:type II secretion system protein [Sinimarinibacterium flocculans]|uniref:type II secretion system protein n=1 Tax=Sinimarinibacterium flocculans TaxID=985250 RepID=UPI003514BF6E
MAGFTIIEMMVTVVIISILATVALPMAEVAVRRNKEQELRQALRQIREALDDYREAVDEGRIEKVAGASGYPPHLQTLVSGVADASSPERARLFFLRRVPRDPFADQSGTPESTWGLRSYESTAENPKPGRDVYDVYSLSDQIGLNGIPYREW